MQNGRQTYVRRIIFRRTYTPAILFWALYLYAGPSNFGIQAKFSGVIIRPLRPLTETLVRKNYSGGHLCYREDTFIRNRDGERLIIELKITSHSNEFTQIMKMKSYHE